MLDQDLQQALDFMRIWITDDAHLGESDISYELEKAEGLRNLEAIEQAIAATAGGYAITFAPTLDRPHETMVGETVFDSEGNAVGWIVNATVGAGTCHTVGMNALGNPPYNQSGLSCNSMECGCSECGAPWSTMGIFRGNKIKHNFKACPICGRKVAK